MDPLQELWDLLEEVPALQAAPTPFMGNPQNNPMEMDHPVTQQRRAVDGLRKQGLPAPEAHEQVYGEVDLSDTDAKRSMAQTLGRAQDDGNRGAVRVDMDAQYPSIMANDMKAGIMTNQTTVDDIRTPMSKQVPDIVQTPDDGFDPQQQQEQVDFQEELDYNWDVAYLQKYGRA